MSPRLKKIRALGMEESNKFKRAYNGESEMKIKKEDQAAKKTKVADTESAWELDR